MNKSLKMVIVMTTIAILSGGLLSAFDQYTIEKVKAHRLKALKAAIAEVLPAYDSYDEVQGKEMTLYVGKKEGQQEPVGVAFRAVGNGFQGAIVTMVGMTPDFKKITGIKVLEQIETPGLGTKIVVDPSNKEDSYWFPNQFKNLSVEPAIEVVKNQKPSKPTEIEAIAGATITSKALARILNAKILVAKKIYQSK